MNTYRKCKAKRNVKAGELVDMTTVEVLGKPVHVPTEADADVWSYHRYKKMCDKQRIALIYIDSNYGYAYSVYPFLGITIHGQMLEGVLMATVLQEHHNKFIVVVNSLKQLDFCVKRGIQPSNIQMVGELEGC